MINGGYFGSLYEDRKQSPFQRQVLTAQQGQTGQQGQIASFAGAQNAQSQQMESLIQLANSQLAQQAAALQSAGQAASSAAERARSQAIQEQNAALQKRQFEAELAASNAVAQEQLKAQRDSELRRRNLLDQQGQQQGQQQTLQPIYSDYGALNNPRGLGGGYRTPYEIAIANGATPEAARAIQNANYAERAGRPGSGVFISGYTSR